MSTGEGTSEEEVPAGAVDFLLETLLEEDDDISVPGDEGAAARIFTSLLAEHAADRIGETWVDELAAICGRIGPKYHSRVYADGSSWGPEALEDLLQDAVVRLLSRGQIEFVVDSANDLGHLRALLTKQVRYTLVDRRRPTQIDNLLERSRRYFESAPFIASSSTPTRWSLASADGSDPFVESATQERLPDDLVVERTALAGRLRRLPRLPAKGVERASPLWSKPTLLQALEDILTTLGPTTFDDLRKIFVEGLTSVTVTEISDGDAGSLGTALSIGPDDEVEANEVLGQLLEGLSDEERAVLAGKFLGKTDADICQELGMSRPTVAARRASAAGRIQDLLSGSNSDVRDYVIQRFQHEVLGLEGSVDDE